MSESAPQPKRLYRDVENGMVGGVAAGLAEYLNVDTTVVRIVVALVILFSFFTGLIAYGVMWVLVPPKPGAPGPVASDEAARSGP